MRMFLKGEWVDREAVREVRDPGTGEAIDTVPEADAGDARDAVTAAAEAFETHHPLPAWRRIAILSLASDAVTARHEELARTIAREGVKTIREARGEVTRCATTLRVAAEEARRVGGETIAFDQAPGSEGRTGWWTREPVGVVVAITPFNDPLNLVAHKVGPAIAAGNAVIVKPHEETPLSALRLAECFESAGLPDGLLQVVTGAGPVVGDALVTDPRVRTVSFSGGRDTGEKIVRRAGLKKVGMELGSIAPNIVMADADLGRAVAACVSGAYWAAGQNCLHVQRILVQEDVAARFTDAFVARAEAYVTGDKLDEKTDMGPLITEEQARRVESWVEEARAAGARLLTGGRRDGTFYAPTLLDRVDPAAKVSCREVFGPVSVLAPFRTLDEAIAIANDVDFGLQGAIFTRDLATAFDAARRLRCGGVLVNESTDFRIDAMPFGGMKGSGLGREGVRFALEEMTEIKMVCLTL
ncbi:MAG: aldehyde dehydrogenase family protein [Gemmatimonadota bacterium]|nr:aldehyde dehydrogenase family protein [Gemmatimonadota bacterium]